MPDTIDTKAIGAPSDSRLGIIIDPILGRSLLECSSIIRSSTPQRFQEMLFALLMYDYAWLPSASIVEANRSASFEMLSKENLIGFIPSRFRVEAEGQLVRRLIAIEHADVNVIGAFDKDRQDLENHAAFLNSIASTEVRMLYPMVSGYHRQRQQSAPPAESQLKVLQMQTDTAASALEAFQEISAVISQVDSDRETIVEEYFEEETKNFNMRRIEDLVLIARQEQLALQSLKSRQSIVSALQQHFRSKGNQMVDAEISQLQYFQSHVEASELFGFSSETNFPMKLSMARPAQSVSVDTSRSDDQYRVYQIIIEEIDGFPRLQSIEDVLRLRGDPRLKNFRDTIRDWEIMLRNGEERYVPFLRQQLQAAVKDLKRISDWNRTSPWATYLALPFWVADKLVLGTLGNLLSGVSSYYQFRSDRLKKRHQWLLLGN